MLLTRMLAIVACLAIHRAFSYTMSYSKISTIKYLAWRGSIFIGWGYSFEWRVFVFLLHSNSIVFHVQMSGLSTLSCPLIVSLLPLQIELSLIYCLWSLKSWTISLMSVASLTPSTILSLIREFFKVTNSHVSHIFLSSVTYWSMVSSLSWALEKNLYLL